MEKGKEENMGRIETAGARRTRLPMWCNWSCFGLDHHFGQGLPAVGVVLAASGAPTAANALMIKARPRLFASSRLLH